MSILVFDLDLTLFPIESNRLPVCTDIHDPNYIYPIHKQAIDIVRQLLLDPRYLVCIASRSRYKARCLDTLRYHGCPSELFSVIVIEHTTKHKGKTPHLNTIIQELDIQNKNDVILFDDCIVNCKSASAIGCQYIHVNDQSGLKMSKSRSTPVVKLSTVDIGRRVKL